MIFYSVGYWRNSLLLFILNIVIDSLAGEVRVMVGIGINIIIYNISIGSMVINIIINIMIGVIKDIIRGVIDIITNIIKDVLKRIVDIVVWVFFLRGVIIISSINFSIGDVRFIFNSGGSGELLLIFS